MEVGIIGLPLAGKTTLYNALTRSQAEVARYHAGQCEIHTAIVDVPDPRVGALVRLFNPRKTAYAKIQFNDIGGVDQGQAKNGGFAPQVLNTMSKCDALVQVVRAFDDARAPHPAGSVDPARDLATLRLELILSDLAIVERRLERIQIGLKKGRDAALLERERLLMERFRETLESGGLISDLDLSAEERALIRGFQFLTAKPALVVVNLPEDAAEPDLSWADHRPGTRALALRGALEMEIAQLPPEEMAPFLASYGIREPSLPLLVRECYQLLGLMSFFTVGEDEVRAWTVRQGATALEAAGTIHSDLARGFIRAEVIGYEDMIACGTLAEARRQGKLRLEGKEYRLKDGDILNIRFNV